MWHVSVAGRFTPTARLWAIAEHELRGAGDATLGEWREDGDRALHLRRRLTLAEMRAGGIGGVLDVRGTPEHRIRIDRMRSVLPPAVRDLPFERFP